MVLRRESLEPPMSQWISIGLLTMSGRTTALTPQADLARSRQDVSEMPRPDSCSAA
jgi:hypothetical protein